MKRFGLVGFFVLLVVLLSVATAQPPNPPRNDIVISVTPSYQNSSVGETLNFTVIVKNNGTVPDIIVVDNITKPVNWIVELKDNGTNVSLPYYVPSKTNTL